MAIGEYGLAKGLAYRHDVGQEIGLLMQQEQYARQARIDSQHRAELITAGLEFGNASNPYDHKLLKEFSDKQLEKIGQFVSENPDFQYNPAKLIYFQNLKKELVNNPIVERARRVDTNMAAFNSYVADPKNKAFIDDEWVREMKIQMDNYNLTGSVDSIFGNNKEFMFYAPEERIDIQAVTAERFGTMQYDGIQELGYDGYKQFVSTDNMYKTALGLWNDPRQGKFFKAKWERLTPEEKNLFNNDPKEWIVEMGRPWKPSDKIDKGNKLGYLQLGEQVRRNRLMEESMGGSKTETANPYYEDIIKPMESGKTEVNVPSKILNKALLNPDGTIDIRDAILPVGGDFQPFPDAGMRKGVFTGKVLKLPEKDGKSAYLAPVVEFEIPFSEFEQLNIPGLHDKTEWFEGEPEFGDYTVKSAYEESLAIRQTKDGFNVVVRTPIRVQDSESLALVYNNEITNRPKGTLEQDSVFDAISKDGKIGRIGDKYYDVKTGQEVHSQ